MNYTTPAPEQTTLAALARSTSIATTPASTRLSAARRRQRYCVRPPSAPRYECATGMGRVEPAGYPNGPEGDEYDDCPVDLPCQRGA